MSNEPTVQQDDVDRLRAGTHWDPHSVLGPHVILLHDRPHLALRAWQPGVKEVALLSNSVLWRMRRIYEEGLYETLLPDTTSIPAYRLRITHLDGAVTEISDPYAVSPLLTEFDLHLFAEGTLLKAYEHFGAHIRTIAGVRGVHFVVWAPNATRVSVIGDFNDWDGLLHPMANRGATGVWELFIPDLEEGTLYKYEIRSREHSALLLKADPYAFASELRPRTASVVRDVSTYRWQDEIWMTMRSTREPLTTPLSIYEVHLGSWMRVPAQIVSSSLVSRRNSTSR